MLFANQRKMDSVTCLCSKLDRLRKVYEATVRIQLPAYWAPMAFLKWPTKSPPVQSVSDLICIFLVRSPISAARGIHRPSSNPWEWPIHVKTKGKIVVRVYPVRQSNLKMPNQFPLSEIGCRTFISLWVLLFGHYKR